MADVPTRIGRVSNNRITSSQPSHCNSSVGSIAANRAHISLFGVEEVNNLLSCHALNLVDITGSLVIAIRLFALVGMPCCVTSHQVRDLHTSHLLALSILSRNPG